jgi:hypothetical protein
MDCRGGSGGRSSRWCCGIHFALQDDLNTEWNINAYYDYCDNLPYSDKYIHGGERQHISIVSGGQYYH